MKSTIQQIFARELGYRVTKYDDKEYLERKAEYDKAYEALEATLNESQKGMLSELFLRESGVESAVEFLSFKYGFCAGVKLGIELCDEEK